MKPLVPLLVAAIACSAGIVWADTPGAMPQSQRQVLPEGIVPVHYDLALFPDAAALSFRGRVAITIDLRAPAERITLNALGLAFDHASVDGSVAAQATYDKALQRATLTLAKRVGAGRHLLTINYHAPLAHATLGFFAMDYVSADGPRRTLATNLEPASARSVLPCWDEPARKATFTVSIDAPKDRMAISNMPIAQVTSLTATTQRVRFAQSPKMSTYLLFVGVGDWERIHDTVDGVDVGVVVKRGDTAKARYALEQASKLLHYYNEYFGMPYPLPKLDLIAAPGQIEGGSMENWGAILYSQNHVLFDPQHSTEQDRQTVFQVVSHEMAHQWFGDLVTMAWWDDLWLNEGFARWMQTYAADDLHPEWQTGLQALDIFEGGKQLDSVPSTHPVVQEIDTPEQAEESFDAITYNKGAAVITMLNAYVGRDKFREGVRRYMRAHAYGNTTDVDLWQPVQEAVGVPIVDIEHDFTRQVGLPLVRVSPTGSGVSLMQGRFADDPATIKDVPPQSWRLPLAVGPWNGAKPYVLLQGTADVAQPPPLLANAGQLGYARVLYSANLLDGLLAHLGELGAADQLGLINDAWVLSIAGYSPASNVTKLAALLPADANPLVWKRLVGIFASLDLHYGDTPARAAFRRFALQLLSPVAARLQAAAAADRSGNVETVGNQLTTVQGALGDAAVIEAARVRTAAQEGTPAEQRAALEIVAAHADAATFDALLARAQQLRDPLEKLNLLRALAAVRDPALARRMIEITLGDQVPSGTGINLLLRIAQWHPDLVWQVMAPRLDDASLPFSKLERWRLAQAAAGGSAEPQRVADLEAYEAKSVPLEARKPFLSAVATIHQNQRIARDVLPDIDRWIAARPAGPGH
jgi:aminopeptidase N